MTDYWNGLVQNHPSTAAAVALLGLVLVAWLASQLGRGVILRAFRRVAERTSGQFDDALIEYQVPKRLAQIIPSAIIQFGVVLIPDLPEAVVVVVRNVAFAFTLLMAMLAGGGVLNAVNATYERRHAQRKGTIKGFVQLLKLALYVLGSVAILAVLIDRSPLILLSGMGAMAAVLMLVFQDTLLSMVASVQISSQDIVRLGDWIEMPQLNADGDVIDIALHTVKVRNWDKTITTLPTRKLISEPFKNWRGMQESGGRRIKRALRIDMQSVRFLESGEVESLRRFRLLRPYLDEKAAELAEHNRRLGDDSGLPVNARRLTNLGTLRAYVFAYLKAHPGINHDLTLIVRQLDPGPEGLPLELYCFTASTAWAAYENVQADIFDHLIAILPEFGLRPFQAPAGYDVREAAAALHEARPPS
ncbi:mechanosensitive ion channel family protein [Pseudofulvimonas gallinarii]|uniref:Mechanosensing system component YbdG n=1 Tax=Pseudofulvimonas gallinarii TaxID=634155 RepID=A0A4R3L8N8_9GAMM|nr:mechanosensitive ion channel domain-containing protein [Pseudofulvimonas gallinarii]TCS96163.1 miniconductance mechanosensitive channel [Pseudofulvimonas gallinarii]THD14596.1 mechanosensitive ion channel protein MscS [Pseudofulvimonas gallinarii]